MFSMNFSSSPLRQNKNFIQILRLLHVRLQCLPSLLDLNIIVFCRLGIAELLEGPGGTYC